MIAGTLEVQMLANLARLADDMNKAKGLVGGAVKSISDSVGKAKAVLATLGVGVSFGALFKDALKEAREFEMQQARLKGVLTATGYSAGLTSRQLNEMGKSLAEVTRFDDESITAAQTNILKFGNITAPVFERTLKLSADMAAVMGTDISSAASMLGKALQSPTEGLKGLTKEFGKLNPEQTAHIENLVKQGKALEAQAAILDLVEGRVGGLAQTMNTGLNKATTDLTKAWNDLLKEMGKTDAIGGQATRTMGGMAMVLNDIRKELEGERTPLSHLLIDVANAMAFVGSMGFVGDLGGAKTPWQLAPGMQRPQIGSRTVDEASRLSQWQKDFDEQQKVWAGIGKVRLGGKGGAAGAGASDLDSTYRGLLKTLQEKLLVDRELTEVNRLQLTLDALSAKQIATITTARRAELMGLAEKIDLAKLEREAIENNAKNEEALAKARQEGAEMEAEFARKRGEALIAGYKHAEQIEFETTLINMNNQERETAIALRSLETSVIGKQSAEYETLAARIRAAIADKALVENNKRAADEIAEQWERVGRVFNNSFSSAFSDFITGAKTARQAFDSFADSVTRRLADMYAEALAKNIYKAMGMGDTSSGSGGFFSGLFNGLFGGSSAGTGAAGYTGSTTTAPGLFGQFATGTDYVPQTGPYLLHKGEAVIPAAENGDWGGDVIINAPIDARGADAGAVQRIEVALGRLERSIVPKIMDAKRRNAFGSFIK